MNDFRKIYYLRWQGKSAGPFTLDEIRHKLRRRQIHSLYKVQVEGDWVLLRDFLAAKKREEDEERKREEEAAQARAREPMVSPPVPVAIPVGDQEDDDWTPIKENDDFGPNIIEQPEEDGSGGGLGLASFILSFGFFIPFLNFFTMATSLVFGHLAFSKPISRKSGKIYAFPKIGLTTSYIHGGFMVLALAYLLGYHLRDAPSALKLVAFFSIHWTMLVNAVNACIGAGMLMLAVKMLAGYVPRFYEAYLAVLLPTSVGSLTMIFVTSASFEKREELFVALGIVSVVMLALQALVWSFMIKDDEDEPLGFAYAAVASLFYTIVFAFIGFLFILLFTSLT